MAPPLTVQTHHRAAGIALYHPRICLATLQGWGNGALARAPQIRALPHGCLLSVNTPASTTVAAAAYCQAVSCKLHGIRALVLCPWELQPLAPRGQAR